jgi:hypothetical protein
MPVLAGVCAQSTHRYLLAAAQHRDVDTWDTWMCICLMPPAQGLKPNYTINWLRVYTNACFCNLAHLCRLRYWADMFADDAATESEGPPSHRVWQSDTLYQPPLRRTLRIIEISCVINCLSHRRRGWLIGGWYYQSSAGSMRPKRSLPRCSQGAWQTGLGGGNSVRNSRPCGDRPWPNTPGGGAPRLPDQPVSEPHLASLTAPACPHGFIGKNLGASRCLNSRSAGSRAVTLLQWAHALAGGAARRLAVNSRHISACLAGVLAAENRSAPRNNLLSFQPASVGHSWWRPARPAVLVQ